MSIQEIAKRLRILNTKSVSPPTTSQLRSGGMQGRVHRQELKRFNNEIATKREKLFKQLDLHNLEFGEFGTELEPFKEPELKKVRSKRGFF